MPKAWLRERWETFLPQLERLTVADEEEIARLCDQEIAYFRERFAGKAPSSLGEPMSDTRVRIGQIPLTEENSSLNEEKGKREHIALKYLNFSKEEWRIIKKPSEASRERRRANMQYLEEPEQIVELATALLSSDAWPDLVVGLAALTGRRLAEIMRYGEVHPKGRYAIWFKGHLKNKKLGLRSYQIPVLAEASTILRAWSRLRRLVDCSTMEEDLISKTYGSAVTAAAEKHFGALIPAVHGDENVTSKTFRKVYARLAFFYLCPRGWSELECFPVVLGHYWENEEGERQTNIKSSIDYTDYDMGDRAVMRANGQRQGVWLSLPGVEPIDAFKPKKDQEKGKPAVPAVPHTKKASQTGNVPITVKEATKDRTDQIGRDLGSRIQDDTVSRLCDDYYRLKQIGALLSPYYEQLGAVSEGSDDLDASLLAVEALVDLLQQAEEDSQGKRDKDKKLLTPFGYLKSLLTNKRAFLAAYGKRHQNKDYTKISLAKLKDTKTPGAAQERFRRAVNAIIAYNDAATVPEQRWYIQAATVVALVDGRPGAAKDYIENGERAEEIKAHHVKHNLHPGDNRKSVKITARITVPDLPEGAASDASGEEAQPEESTEEETATEE